MLADLAPAMQLINLVKAQQNTPLQSNVVSQSVGVGIPPRRPLQLPSPVQLDYRRLSHFYHHDNHTNTNRTNDTDDKTNTSPFAKRTERCIDVLQVHLPILIKPIGVEGFDPQQHLPSAMRGKTGSVSYFVAVSLVYGGNLLCPTAYSTFSLSPLWATWITLDYTYATLPPESRFCFTLYVLDRSYGSTATKTVGEYLASSPSEGKPKPHPLGWVNMTVTDHTGALHWGQFRRALWPDGPANPIGTDQANLGAPNALYFIAMLPSPPCPVVYFKTPHGDKTPPSSTSSPSTSIITAAASDRCSTISPGQMSMLEKIMAYDALTTPSVPELELLWAFRDHLRQSFPHKLALLLLAVHWPDVARRRATHLLLQSWPLISPELALGLLDAKFADTRVRQYAVACLDAFSDPDLLLYLLQLVQALKYEPRHCSSLARFLIIRAVRCPQVGHRLFWLLMAEIDMLPSLASRFLLILDAFLHEVDAPLCQEFFDGLSVIRKLHQVGTEAKKWAKSARPERLARALETLCLPSRFGLPINPRLDLTGLNQDKCKCMQSNAVPLWLSFSQADPQARPAVVMFKVGDDLRKDILIVQMFTLMDRIWKDEGLDLPMHPYGVVLTGHEAGMIEIVSNSVTTATIHKLAGGATGAFKDSAICDWLRSKNAAPEAWDVAVSNFIHSCAAYCVATYVLGIGDRHNDNIMLKENGCLFHIDFAHVLGHFLKFGFVDRETAPFVFTPEFAFTMGGEHSHGFAQFTELSVRAYLVLRKHADLFFSLFRLMLSSGISGLSSYDDIQYLKTAFSLDMNDDDASQHFRSLIMEALGTRRTRLNNFIHIVAN